MKVSELIDSLLLCDPDARIFMNICADFQDSETHERRMVGYVENLEKYSYEASCSRKKLNMVILRGDEHVEYGY